MQQASIDANIQATWPLFFPFGAHSLSLQCLKQCQANAPAANT